MKVHLTPLLPSLASIPGGIAASGGSTLRCSQSDCMCKGGSHNHGAPDHLHFFPLPPSPLCTPHISMLRLTLDLFPSSTLDGLLFSFLITTLCLASLPPSLPTSLPTLAPSLNPSLSTPSHFQENDTAKWREKQAELYSAIKEIRLLEREASELRSERAEWRRAFDMQEM